MNFITDPDSIPWQDFHDTIVAYLVVVCVVGVIYACGTGPLLPSPPRAYACMA